MDNQENKIPEKYLPLGTVVLLKGGKKEIMILSYCIVPTGKTFDKNGEVKDLKMFDYGACAYPEGMITSDQLFAFNHDQIDKVCHIGYQSDAGKEFTKRLSENQEKMQEVFNGIKEMKEKKEAQAKTENNDK